MAKKKYTSASVISLASGIVRPGQNITLDDSDATALLAAGMIYPAPAAKEADPVVSEDDAAKELQVKLEEMNILIEAKDLEIEQLKEKIAELKKAEKPEEKSETTPEEELKKPAKAKT